MFLKSFSFWDIANVEPKFQPSYAYKLYAYIKMGALWFNKSVSHEINY